MKVIVDCWNGRLAENKGGPRIDWETVLCMEKP